MTDAPEMIWVNPPRRFLQHDMAEAIAYVPADRLTTLQAENASLCAQADKLAEALRACQFVLNEFKRIIPALGNERAFDLTAAALSDYDALTAAKEDAT